MKATAVAYRRGVRVLAPEDLLFLLRHDVHRSARLKEFLSWKDVRKNAKPAGTNSGTTAAAGGSTTASANTDDLMEINEEDAKQLADPSSATSNNTATANTSTSQVKTVQIGGPKRRQLGLFWELGSCLLTDVLQPSLLAEITPPSALSPAQQAACQRETMRRLRQADLLTQTMSQTEYMEYSECRQASFTYKKARKFREWLVGGTARPGCLNLGGLAGGSGRDLARLGDDTLEILGFLAYEMVQRVTESGLAVKWESESANGSNSNGNNNNMPSKKRPGIGGIFEVSSPETTDNPPPPNQKSPLLPQHIEEAYRRIMLPENMSLQRGLSKRRNFIL